MFIPNVIGSSVGAALVVVVDEVIVELPDGDVDAVEKVSTEDPVSSTGPVDLLDAVIGVDVAVSCGLTVEPVAPKSSSPVLEAN